MSQMGHSGRFECPPGMSALPLIATELLTPDRPPQPGSVLSPPWGRCRWIRPGSFGRPCACTPLDS
jgi:hypothetical protein